MVSPDSDVHCDVIAEGTCSRGGLPRQAGRLDLEVGAVVVHTRLGEKKVK